MQKPTITVKLALHKGQNVIQLIYAYNKSIDEALKLLRGVRWSMTMRCWYMPYDEKAIGLLGKVIADYAHLDVRAFTPSTQSEI